MKTIWKYNGYVEGLSGSISQHDWNQTLITKINEISCQIHKRTMNGGANTLIASLDLKPIFASFEYFNSINNTLSGRYRVLFEGGGSRIQVMNIHHPNEMGVIKVVGLPNNNGSDPYSPHSYVGHQKIDYGTPEETNYDYLLIG